MAASSGAVHVELRGVEEDVARRALRAAREALFTIPHPEEEEDPLPSFASDVSAGERGPTFWFDIADAESYDGLIDWVIEVMCDAIEAEAPGAVLAWPDAP